MTAAGSACRLAGGGGMHASLLLLIPFGIDSRISPGIVVAVLGSSYFILQLLSVSAGMLGFIVSGCSRGLGEQKRVRIAIASSASLVACLYAALPASLALTEGVTVEVISVSTVAFLLGFFVHLALSKVAFSRASGRAFISVAVSLPLLLVFALAMTI